MLHTFSSTSFRKHFSKSLIAGTVLAYFVIGAHTSIAQDVSPFGSEEVSESRPEIISSSYPDQKKWYNSRETSFAWELPASIDTVRTLYNDKTVSVPNKVYDPPISNKSFTLDADGIFYFHLQFASDGEWGQVAHYKFQVDTKEPSSLTISFMDGPSITSPTPEIIVTARDELSGIAFVEMSVDGGDKVRWPVNSSNIYRLPKTGSGEHTALISVYDKAGNFVDSSLSYTIETLGPPVLTVYSKRVGFMDDFTVSGIGYPRSMVEAVLIGEDEKTFSQKTPTNDKGSFTLRWNGELPRGMYEMRVRMADINGATSPFTDPKIVRVESLGLIKVGVFVMNWLSLVIIMVLAIAAVLITAWYSLGRFGTFRRRVVRTMMEAENTLRINVQALRRDIAEFHDILIKTQKKRELTKEEQTIMKKLKKRLDIAEKEIEKKLESLQ